MIFSKEKNEFLGSQLQVAVNGHDLWASETYIHKTLTMSNKSLLSRKILLGNGKLPNKIFFVSGSTCRIFVSAEYSAENVLRTNRRTIPCTVFCTRWVLINVLLFAFGRQQSCLPKA
jgi:hypothetical protein